MTDQNKNAASTPPAESAKIDGPATATDTPATPRSATTELPVDEPTEVPPSEPDLTPAKDNTSEQDIDVPLSGESTVPSSGESSPGEATDATGSKPATESSAVDEPEMLTPGDNSRPAAASTAEPDPTPSTDTAVDEGNAVPDHQAAQPATDLSSVENAPLVKSTPTTAPAESHGVDQSEEVADCEPRTIATTGGADHPRKEPAGEATRTAEIASENVPAETSTVGEPEQLTIENVDSFADFLRFLAGLDGDLKPLELKKGSAARTAISKATNLAQFENELCDIVARDSKLTTALSLMLTADKSDLTGAARRTVTALAAHILGGYPAFVADSVFRERLTRLAAGDADADTLPRLVDRLRNLLDGPFDGKDTLKAPALHALSDNAIHTVILITASAAKWDAALCIEALADNVWSAGTPHFESAAHREKLAVLPKSARKAASLIVGTARVRLRAVEDERDTAARQAETAQTQVRVLSAELTSSRHRVEELDAELATARSGLQLEIDARRSERMGATSDFEMLRVDTARAIAEQIESLEDALDALGHGQPQITEEFVRRSVITLRRSLKALQPHTKQDSEGDKE